MQGCRVLARLVTRTVACRLALQKQSGRGLIGGRLHLNARLILR